MDSIRVFAPATVANVVCGYDVLGFALDNPGDEVTMRITNNPGIRITKITGDNGKLSMDPARNTVGVSVQHFLQAIEKTHLGIEIELHKQMPIGSGLGSSSASTVAGLFAINQLLNSNLTLKELLPFAMKGEEIACGTGHADNVAPALYGGFVLIRSYDPLDVISLPFPPELHCAVVFPEVDVPTRDARQLIRSKVLLKDAVTQWGNIAGLVSGLFLNDTDLIGRSMKDIIIEPARAMLIPDFYKLREVAMQNGAIGFGISGSGPSVFSFTHNKPQAVQISKALQNHLSSINVFSKSYTSSINESGPKILD
ncbi:MAG: homoserine kinase [Flavobacterium sp.]|nr:homoserine kinase [Pedobacter sp.]